MFLFQINVDEHVSTKRDTLRIYKGGRGGGGGRFFFKKSIKMEAFTYLFFFGFLTWLPESPKLWACSLAPLK